MGADETAEYVLYCQAADQKAMVRVADFMTEYLVDHTIVCTMEHTTNRVADSMTEYLVNHTIVCSMEQATNRVADSMTGYLMDRTIVCSMEESHDQGC